MKANVVEVFDSHSLWVCDVKSCGWVANTQDILEVVHRLELTFDEATEWG
jgi:hypothetical protein